MPEKKLSRFPRSLKRLKCKTPVNYQCGGKCQPIKNNCKKMALGMAKNGLEYLKAVEERKARIAKVNAKRGGRAQYAVNDRGDVSRGTEGRNADPNKRFYRREEQTLKETAPTTLRNPTGSVTMKKLKEQPRKSTMTTEQQQLIDKNNAAIEKAKKTGKFTRLGEGQYYLYANDTLYYISKREFLAHRRWQTEWTWRVDGASYPNDSFDTLAEAKYALYQHLELNKKR